MFLAGTAIAHRHPRVGGLSEEKFIIVIVDGNLEFVALICNGHRRVVHHEPERKFSPKANDDP
jgi:hypothetical protein